MSDRIKYVLTDPEGAPFVELAEVETVLHEGKTIREFMNVLEWDSKFNLPTIVTVDGHPVLRRSWDEVKVTRERTVTVLVRPGSGGTSGTGGGANSSKGLMISIGVLVGMIAATALLAWAAPALAGSLGMSAGVIKAIGGLLISAGGLLLMQFLMPKASKAVDPKEESIYSIGADGNTAAPLEPIPVGYGRTLREPNLAAPPYTLYAGNKQTLYELFCIGCGEYDIERVLINDTLVWSGGIPTTTFPGMQIQFYGPGETVLLADYNVVTSSEVGGIELEDNQYRGPFAANPAGTQADQIWIDLVWSSAYAIRKEKQYAVMTPIVVEYAPIDDAGAETAGYSVLIARNYSNSSRQEIRITEQVPVTPGRYSVRLRRTNKPLSADTLPEGIEASDDVTWSALRAHIQGPSVFEDVTMMAVVVPASESISALSARRWSVVGTRKIPIWDEEEEDFTVPTITRNPVDVLIDIWVNDVYSAGLEFGNLDIETLMSYRTFFATNNMTFDHFFKSQQTIYEALETVLKVVKSIPAFVGDKLSMVRDEPKMVRQMFTDREIVRGSLSIHRRLADEELADGVTVQYIDERTWNLSEVSSAPNLANAAVVQIDGVVQRIQAYDLALYLAAVNKYRRRAVTFDVELEGRMLRRGDLVAVQSALPRTWGTASYVVFYSSGTRTLTLATELPWNLTGSHWIEVRNPRGGLWGPVLVTKGATANLAIIDATDLAAVQAVQGPISAALSRDDTEEEASVAFSPGTKRTFRGLVQGAAFKGSLCTVNLIIEALQPYEIPTEPVEGVVAFDAWGGAFHEPSADAGIELSLGRKRAKALANLTDQNVRGDVAQASGLKYFEFRFDAAGDANFAGVSAVRVGYNNDTDVPAFLGAFGSSAFGLALDGTTLTAGLGAGSGSIGMEIEIGVWYGMAANVDTQTVWVTDDGIDWNGGSGNPLLGTGGVTNWSELNSDYWWLGFTGFQTGDQITIHTEMHEFVYAPPGRALPPPDPTFPTSPVDNVPRVHNLIGEASFVDPDWILTADWDDFEGADQYELQISYDNQVTWETLATPTVSEWEGEIESFDGSAYIRARAHTPSFGWGPYSVTAVNQPVETEPPDPTEEPIDEDVLAIVQPLIDELWARINTLRLDDLIDVMSAGDYAPADGAVLTFDDPLGQWIPSDTEPMVILGIALETDTALPLAVSTGAPIGQATETDTAFPVTRRGRVPVGQALEVDTAGSINPTKGKVLGQATETDTAFSMVAGQTPINLTPPEIYVVS